MLKLRFSIIYSILLICATFGVYPASVAQAEPSAITLSVPQDRILVFGDSLTVIIRVIIPTGYNPAEPVLPSSASDVHARIIWRENNLLDSDTEYLYGLHLYAFTPDTLKIDPVTVPVTDPAGEVTSLVSDTLVIPVGTVLAAADSMLLPNRLPVSLAGGSLLPSWVKGLAFLFILVAIVFAFLFWNKRNQHSIPVTAQSIDELAIFLELKKHAYHEHGKLKDLYVQLSAALRGFIHRNMSFDAMYETTSEILTELGNSSYDQNVIDAFRTLLTEADQVNFAKFVPPYSTVSSAVDRALEPVQAVLAENEQRRNALLDDQSGTQASGSETPLDNSDVAQSVERSG